MRRIASNNLRCRQLHHLRLVTLSRPSSRITQVLRPFTTSTASLYPRSGPRGWSPSASDPPDDPASQIHEDDDDFPDDLSEAGLPPGADPPPLPDSFSSVVTSIVPPTRTDSPLPDDLRPLLAHVLTTFLPANQPCTPTLVKAQTGMPGVSGPFAFHNGMPATIVEEDGGDQEDARTAEAVLALVTPFEGGKHYVLDAVQRVASEVDAEVLRFDLALGLGLDGSAAPLASTGRSRRGTRGLSFADPDPRRYRSRTPSIGQSSPSDLP